MPPQPFDNEHSPVPSYELLSAIERQGADWMSAVGRYGLDAVSEAITREIDAGHLLHGPKLTDRGRRFLIESRARQRSG